MRAAWSCARYDDGEGGSLPDLLWGIINAQSFQMLAMQKFLGKQPRAPPQEPVRAGNAKPGEVAVAPPLRPDSFGAGQFSPCSCVFVRESGACFLLPPSASVAVSPL